MKPPLLNFSWTQITQFFAFNFSLYMRQFRQPGHQALDMVGDGPNGGYGEPVFASFSGTARTSHNHPTKGNSVDIHAGNMMLRYFHLSEILVGDGQLVGEGQVIGRIGNTGYVLPKPTQYNPKAGAHLHFEVLINGLRVDPVPLLYKEGDRFAYKLKKNLYPLPLHSDDVAFLHTLLRLENVASFQPTGLFGPLTTYSVMKLQSRNGITPAPACGPQTRRLLSKYSIS